MAHKKFIIYKEHKIQQHIEDEATSWVDEIVCEWYGVEDSTTLRESQILEVVDCWETTEDMYISIALRNVISLWESENDHYLEI